MKMKLNLKKLKVKELFVGHVEKLVLGVAVVCLLLFVFSAATREKLPAEETPDKLKAACDQAKTYVANSEFDPKTVRPPEAPVYERRVARPPVDLAFYQQKVPIDGPILDANAPRSEPEYLPPIDLRIGVGSAPFATIDPALADGPKFEAPRPRNLEDEVANPEDQKRNIVRENQKGYRVGPQDKLIVKYWAMVTALLPIRAQKAAYLKAFEQAANYEPEQDIPSYLGFIIERAEVTSGDMASLEWSQVKRDADFILSWAGEMPEVATPDYVTDKFVTRLGPRVGTDWEDYVAHSPEVPVAPKAGTIGGEMGRGMPGPMRGNFGDEDMPGRGGRGGVRGGRPGAAGQPGNPIPDIFQGGPLVKDQPIEELTPAEMARLNETVAIVQEMQNSEKQIKGLDHLLFRFCDFTVQPGKQYVYRVRLGLRNPNRGVPVRYLKDPKLAEGDYKLTEFSTPSPIATIPFGDKIFAGSVSPSSTKEPTAKVRIVQVKEDVGVDVPVESELFRGSIANLLRKETTYVDPRTGNVEKYTGDFITDTVLLDMRGGRVLFVKDKTNTEPGELLVLTRTGKVLAMNEFDDEETWSNYAVPEEQKLEEMSPERRGMLEDDGEMPGRARGRRPAPDPLRGGAAGKR